MTPDLIKRYNALLAFHGTIPYGEHIAEGIFQLRKARELVLPHKTGTKIIALPSGIDIVVPVYEMIPQLRPQDADRWVIAKWLNPTEEEWDKAHESKMEWPRHGYFFCFLPLEPSREPSEEQIRAFVDHIEYQKSLTPQQHLEKVVEQGEKPFEVYTSKVNDIMDQTFVNHVPGKRGGVYLAFSEPSNKPPRSIPETKPQSTEKVA